MGVCRLRPNPYAPMGQTNSTPRMAHIYCKSDLSQNKWLGLVLRTRKQHIYSWGWIWVRTLHTKIRKTSLARLYWFSIANYFHFRTSTNYTTVRKINISLLWYTFRQNKIYKGNFLPQNSCNAAMFQSTTSIKRSPFCKHCVSKIPPHSRAWVLFVMQIRKYP